MKREYFETCGEAVPGFELMRVGSVVTGFRQVCSQCSFEKIL